MKRIIALCWVVIMLQGCGMAFEAVDRVAGRILTGQWIKKEDNCLPQPKPEWRDWCARAKTP